MFGFIQKQIKQQRVITKKLQTVSRQMMHEHPHGRLKMFTAELNDLNLKQKLNEFALCFAPTDKRLLIHRQVLKTKIRHTAQQVSKALDDMRFHPEFKTG